MPQVLPMCTDTRWCQCQGWGSWHQHSLRSDTGAFHPGQECGHWWEESSWRCGQPGDNCFNPTLAHPTLIPGLMLIHTMQRKLASSYNSWLWAKSDSNCPALPLYQVLIWALREVFISSGQFWRHTNKHWVMQTTDSEVRIVTSCDVVTCAGCRCHMVSHDVTDPANQKRVLTWQEPIKRKSPLYSNVLFTEDFPHK